MTVQWPTRATRSMIDWLCASHGRRRRWSDGARSSLRHWRRTRASTHSRRDPRHVGRSDRARPAWLDEIVAGTVTGVDQVAAREKCSIRPIHMMISLAFLAPELVKVAVEGRLPRGIGVTRLCDAILLPAPARGKIKWRRRGGFNTEGEGTLLDRAMTGMLLS